MWQREAFFGFDLKHFNVGIGTTSPAAERLDLGGGNIKMGYEVRFSGSIPGALSLTVPCPGGKKVIGGGCAVTGVAGAYITQSFPQFENQWTCGFSSTTGTKEGYAICANIR